MLINPLQSNMVSIAQAADYTDKTTYNSLIKVVEISSVEIYEQVKEKATHVDTVLIIVDKDGNVIDSNGKAITRLSKAYSELKSLKIATSIYISDKETFDMVASELSSYKDIAVVAKKDVLPYVRTTLTWATGILDLREEPELSVKEIRDVCNNNNARNVILSGPNLNKDKVIALNKLLVFTWGMAQTQDEAYMVLATECSAILTTDVNFIITAISTFSDLLVKRPLVVAHRGKTGIYLNDNGDMYPENGVQTAVAAAKYGADIIEIDVHLSLDKKVVVMHDLDLKTTTDANGTIEESNYIGYIDQFKIYDKSYYGINGGQDADPYAETVPLLEHFFTALKSTKCNLFIEIKTSGTSGNHLIDEVIELIEEYGYDDRVCFISFYKDQLDYLHKNYPRFSTSLLHSSAYQDIESTMTESNRYNSAYSPNASYMQKQTAYELNKRGVICSAWTYQTVTKFYNDYSYIDVLTTDSMNYVSDCIKKLIPSTRFVGKSPKNAVRLKAYAQNYHGSNYKVYCNAVQIGGEGVLKTTNSGSYYIEGDSVQAIFYYSYTESWSSEMHYTVLSEAVTLTSKNGINALIIVSIVESSILLGAGVVILSIRRKKNENRSKARV
ncbi:MAG TPA: glycerophosphodiester phosphodiesterase family protein [Clostridia bacterium]